MYISITIKNGRLSWTEVEKFSDAVDAAADGGGIVVQGHLVEAVPG